ncbi:MAG: class I SAM-dependent methyltransferase [Bryobacteraceae bacterium]|nr:class I SAM-dependent methyltransferase [Bryobacteraceae bacterium]
MRTLGGLVAVSILAGGLWAQGTHPVTGRKIAPVMGMGGADWLERAEREEEERPEMALDLIGVAPGMVVADIGAGVGYFTIRLARRVGPEGKVYANEIQPGMLSRLKENARREGLSNVEPVLGTESDPRLPVGSIDLALLVDVYHEFSRPEPMTDAIRAALKPDGRLVLLEYRKEDPAIPIREEHKMTIEQARRELAPQGFILDKALHELPRQHILIFRKKLN